MADTAAATAGTGTPATTPPAAPLDEVMLAMDVVDTLRHREHLVARELAEGARKETLIERLRSIYAAQGIEVPDHVLEEGVEALKRERFAYAPPAPGFQVTLAKLYVTRRVWGMYLGIALAVLVVGYAGYVGLVRWPAEQAAENARIELAETLPADLKGLRDIVLAEAEVDTARTAAEKLYETGMAAVGAGDAAGARSAVAELRDLRSRVEQEYVVRIVNRPEEQSGVWRIPDTNTNARNYYLIVEAIGGDGKPVSVPIRNEETGATINTSRWGVRVSETTFDRIRLDKRDDGIIQNDLMAMKVRGTLDPEYRLPVTGGAITEW